MRKTRTKVLDCKAAANTVHDVLNGLDHEEVWGIFLTNDNTIISTEMLSMGTLTQTSIDSRTIIKRALMINAQGFILLHNHPSGNPLPSLHDIELTSKLRKACDLMELSLLDHIILADDCYFSFSGEKVFEYDGTVE